MLLFSEHLYVVDEVVGVRIPNCRCVFNQWTHESFVGVGFEVSRFDSDVTAKKRQGIVRFFRYVGNVTIPLEVILNRHTQIFCRGHQFQWGIV